MARNSTKARRICFETHRRLVDGKTVMECHLCRRPIDPVRDKWEADHIRRFAEDGEDTAENLFPAHAACHKVKSAKDTTEVAKGKRVKDNHYGVRKRGWYRPKGVKFNWGKGRYEKDE